MLPALKLCVLDRFFIVLATLFVAVSLTLPADADEGKNGLDDAAFATLADALVYRQVAAHLPESHPWMVRAHGAASDLRAATERLDAEGKIPAGELARWEAIAYVFSFYESGFQADPSGYNDAGSACGVGQAHMVEKVDPTLTCALVRTDRKLGYRAMLLWLLKFEAACGSRRAALSAYATDGRCHTWTPKVVAWRCAQVPGEC